jgi:erythromycin esterase
VPTLSPLSRFATALALALAAACAQDPGPAVEAPPALADPGAASALAWIDASATPVSTTASDDADLAPLDAMVADARVIGMGEGTHGTRELVQLRARMLRRLVRTAGVRALAVEATLAEGIALDRYVRGGAGDPRVLLSRLYFWVTNTQEMLDVVQWLRAHNAGRPAAEQVGFVGVDVQYYGAAIDSVSAYAARRSAPLGAFVASQYACFRDYRNDVRGRAAAFFGDASVDVKARCRAAATAVRDSIAARGAGAPSADAHDLALRLATVVEQYTSAYGSGGSAARDAAMADNTLWALRRLGAGARVVLWAHNAHVAVRGRATGGFLRDSLGAAYVAIATAFDDGTVTARPTLDGAPTALAVPPARDDSYEAVFRRSRHAAFVADVRAAPVGLGRSWLNAGLPLRAIGAVYDAARPASSFSPASLLSDYGIVAFVRRTQATTVLPFDYGS